MAHSRRRRLLLPAVLLLTGIGAMFLIARFWALDAFWRHYVDRHCEEVQRLRGTQATVTQIDALLGSPNIEASPDDAARLARIWTNPLNGKKNVRGQVEAWPATRVYVKGDGVVYLVSFDRNEVMQEVACLSN
jgi:hypothetical protein